MRWMVAKTALMLAWAGPAILCAQTFSGPPTPANSWYAEQRTADQRSAGQPALSRMDGVRPAAEAANQGGARSEAVYESPLRRAAVPSATHNDPSPAGFAPVRRDAAPSAAAVSPIPTGATPVPAPTVNPPVDAHSSSVPGPRVSGPTAGERTLENMPLPPAGRRADPSATHDTGQAGRTQRETARSGAPSLTTVGGSLAVVLGLILLVAWILRKTSPAAGVPLPKEVFEVLGRAPLATRQQVHLLRCGKKLLLVSVTPAGVETLTEVEDPVEVDRLAGLCQQARPDSATSVFRHVFQQFAQPSPATGPSPIALDEPLRAAKTLAAGGPPQRKEGGRG